MQEEQAPDPVTEKSAEEVVAEAKAAAAQPENPQATAGPMAEVPVPQREIAAAIMHRLIDSRENIAQTVAAMMASRQLYAVAVRDLELITAGFPEAERLALFQAALSQLKEPLAEPPDPLATFELVEEMLIQAAAYGASKPFSDATLYLGLKKTVLPWLEKTVQRHNRLAAKEKQVEIEAYEQARRERPVPIGMVHTEGKEPTLPRDRSLVLFGWRPAVLWVLDQMVTGALAARDDQLYTVIRLMTKATKVTPQAHLLRLGGRDWEDCCKNGTSWPKLFQSRLFPQLSDPPDLLVVDDLAYAGKSTSLLGGSPARMAGNAQKRFRDWCNKIGCALVGGVLFDNQELVSPASMEWEQLRTFTTLRAVSVVATGDNYRITLGRDAAFFTVEKAVLDSYGTGNIIVPTGSTQGIVQ